jgi:hypothetical protein
MRAEVAVCNVQASTSATAPPWSAHAIEGRGRERLERGSAARLTSPRSESAHLWGRGERAPW